MPRRGENIYKRKDGRWEGRYAVGKRADGGTKYASIYGKSYREVKESLIRLKSAVQPKSMKIKFSKAAEEWLAHVRTYAKKSTCANYTYLLNKHILPYFEKMTLDELSPAEVNRFIDDKLQNGKLKRDEGLSKKYMWGILSVVKLIARFGEEQYEIPCRIDRVKVPKEDVPDFEIMSDDDRKNLSNYVTKEQNAGNTAICVALYTGMRIGEICGLKWEDYDAENRTIAVKRTVQRISDNEGHTYILEGSPKTKSSERVIPLPDIVCRQLNSMQRDGDYVVGQEPYKVRKHFNKALKDCGLKPMRFHHIRHNFASYALRMQFDIKALSEILGHANAAMTLNRYAHTSMDVKRKYMDKLTA